MGVDLISWQISLDLQLFDEFFCTSNLFKALPVLRYVMAGRGRGFGRFSGVESPWIERDLNLLFRFLSSLVAAAATLFFPLWVDNELRHILGSAANIKLVLQLN